MAISVLRHGPRLARTRDLRPALAVAEGRLPADKAFAAAQLDELYQIERWGEDPTSTLRHENIKHDIEAGARFLALLENHRLKG